MTIPDSTPDATMMGRRRPFGMGYWPLPEDDPGVAVRTEEVRIVTDDLALVRGVLWTPPAGTEWRTAVVVAHPRGDFSVHYACPLLAAAGYAVLGVTTRYLNNDQDCLHEACVTDVEAAVAEMRRRGADAVVLFGNSGGGSLMAMTQARTRCGDGWIGCAAHPGEGVFMGKVIDPSVADEADPFTAVAELDMYDPANGWRPWPQPCTYDRDWLARYRSAQAARIARIDAVARAALADNEASRALAHTLEPGTDAWRNAKKRQVHGEILTIYRTLADPAYLDPSIDPDDRPLGSLFAFPDPFVANYGRGGLGRTMTARGWLSTWSALSSAARLDATLPEVKVPTLIVHPTADTEIRLSEARAIRDSAGAEDVSYHEMKGAPHYLEGHRPAAMELVTDWLRARY